MRDWQGKRYWLIGASEGLGRALALQLSRAGAEVIVSARSRDRLDDLVSELPGKGRAVPVDVSVRGDVERAAAEIGEIDGMVYLAGIYWPMPAQDWDAEKAEAMTEVNYLGAVRSVGAVIGPMVDRDRGHIVLTSSLSAFRGLPGAIGYAASKSGVTALAECMYADLRKTGVAVQVVSPGFIESRLTGKNTFNMPQIMSPETAAQGVFEHMTSGGFKTSFPAPFAWLFRLGQFFPDWLWYGIMTRK